MKPLSDTLQAMPLHEGLPKEQQRGLTTTDGRTSLAKRDNPLTQNQVTLIQSKLLRELPRITCETETIYGTKTYSDEFGEFSLQEQPIGKRNVLKVDMFVDAAVSQEWFDAALRLSPPDAYVRYVSHLALHKKFGSDLKDRAVLISDYADALSEFPEFVVAMVCEGYWKHDKRPFIPYIAEMIEACQSVTNRIMQSLASSRPATPATKAVKEIAMNDVNTSKDRHDIPRSEWSAHHWDEHIADAAAMLDLAVQNPSIFSPEEWQAELSRRKTEREEWQKK